MQKANVNVNEVSKPVTTTDSVKIVGCSECHVWYVLADRRSRSDAEKIREVARKMNYDWRKTVFHSSWDIADLGRLQTPAVPVTSFGVLMMFGGALLLVALSVWMNHNKEKWQEPEEKNKGA